MDYKMIEKLGMLHCTDDEIAAFLEVSMEEVARFRKGDVEFTEALKRGEEQAKINLRRLQWKKADAGDSAMLIFLGKQLLGQSGDAENRPHSLRKPGKQPR